MNIKDFPEKVQNFCENQHYYRATPVTEVEFSQVAHRLYSCFFLSDLDLEQLVVVTNCVLLARLRQIDLQAPHVLDKIEEASRELIDDTETGMLRAIKILEAAGWNSNFAGPCPSRLIKERINVKYD